MSYLDEIEVKILSALAQDPDWHNAVELADKLDLHQQIVRSRLKGLSRFGWVERGAWSEGWGRHGWGANWGRYRITKRGRHELAHRNQMRLVV